jgi:hypothetical protein
VEEVMQLRLQNDKNIQKMREGFEANLADLRSRCEERLKQVDDHLKMRPLWDTSLRDKVVGYHFMPPSVGYELARGWVAKRFFVALASWRMTWSFGGRWTSMRSRRGRTSISTT